MRIRTVLAAAAAPAALAAVLLGTTGTTAAHAATLTVPTTPSTITCTNGQVVSGTVKNVDVPAGVSCQIDYATVTGQVTVEGNLGTASSIYDHNIVVTGGSLWFFNGPSHVKGNVWVLGSPGDPNSQKGLGDNADQYGTAADAASAQGTVIDGQLTYVDNSGWLYAGAPLFVHGNFVYALNTHPANQAVDYPGLTVSGHSFVS
jgi:hypothetical protein